MFTHPGSHIIMITNKLTKIKLRKFLMITAIIMSSSIFTLFLLFFCYMEFLSDVEKNIELIPQTTIQSSYPLSKEIKEEIKMASSKFKPGGYDYSKPALFEAQEEYQGDDIYGCCQYCNYLVARKLSFTFKKKGERKPNEGNCVDYAAMMTEACNYAFKINGLNAKAYHTRGIVKYHGVDMYEKLGKYDSFF